MDINYFKLMNCIFFNCIIFYTYHLCNCLVKIKIKLRSKLHQEHLLRLMLMALEKDLSINTGKLIRYDGKFFQRTKKNCSCRLIYNYILTSVVFVQINLQYYKL